MKTIIEMARKAGFEVDVYPEPGLHLRLERLDALIRADECEACAEVCDEMAFDWQKYVTTPSGTITACAAAIRARGNT